MQVAARTVLGRFTVGPDEDPATGGDDRPGRDRPLRFVGEHVGQIVAAEIRRDIGRIVELEPVLVVVVGGITKRGGVVSHPLIEDHRHRRLRGVVGSARRRQVKWPPRRCPPVRIGAERTGDDRERVVQVVQDPRAGRSHLDQPERARREGWTEGGMEFGGIGLARFGIEEHEAELAWSDGMVRRESPTRQVRPIVRKEQSCERNRVRAGVDELHPWLALVETIPQASGVGRLKLVQPDRRELLDHRPQGIRRRRGRRLQSAGGGRKVHSKNNVARSRSRLVDLGREDIGAEHKRSGRQTDRAFQRRICDVRTGERRVGDRSSRHPNPRDLLAVQVEDDAVIDHQVGEQRPDGPLARVVEARAEVVGRAAERKGRALRKGQRRVLDVEEPRPRRPSGVAERRILPVHPVQRRALEEPPLIRELKKADRWIGR